jgi:Tfp pilus assembly protein PilE
MKRGRIGRRKILAIIIGGIIAGILAAIAVPLYTGYVERARVIEANGIMGTIITSQKVEKRRTGKYYSAWTIAEFKSRRVDITDTKFFTYETVTTPNGGFAVTATPTDAFGPAGGWVAYIYDPSADPPGRWESKGYEGSTILPDILPLLS